MVEVHSINCALEIWSSVLLLIGISLSTTRQLLIQRVYADDSGTNVAIGFAYIIPGLAGLIAALLQRRRWYISHSVLGSICLVIMFVVYLMGLSSHRPEEPFSPERCYIKDLTCVCSSSYLTNLVNYGFTCDDFHFVNSMGIASDVLFVLGSIILVIIITMSGILSRIIQQLDGNKLISDTKNVYFRRESDAITTA